MMELTKERLAQILRAIDSEAYDESGIMGWFNSDDIMKMARQLLASMEQEPVAYIDPFTFKNFATYRAGETDNNRMGREWVWAKPDTGLIPLYAAPQLPQPAVVPDEVIVFLNHLEDVLPDEAFNLIDVKTWNNVSMLSRPEVYRAAMLQGAEPVSQPNTLREGLAAIRNSGIAIDAEKIQAERDALNEPDVPDGYALVPLEPTAEMIEATFAGEMELQSAQHQMRSRERRAHYYRAMLAAAPQQEADNG